MRKAGADQPAARYRSRTTRRRHPGKRDTTGGSMVEVSIVVPSHAGERRLPTILASLRRQTLSDLEMIVVLDGEVDGSADIVRRAAADLPVSLVVFPENRGRAAALNAGFRAAKGEVLVRADDDLELEDDFAGTTTASMRLRAWRRGHVPRRLPGHAVRRGLRHER